MPVAFMPVAAAAPASPSAAKVKSADTNKPGATFDKALDDCDASARADNAGSRSSSKTQDAQSKPGAAEPRHASQPAREGSDTPPSDAADAATYDGTNGTEKISSVAPQTANLPDVSEDLAPADVNADASSEDGPAATQGAADPAAIMMPTPALIVATTAAVPVIAPTGETESAPAEISDPLSASRKAPEAPLTPIPTETTDSALAGEASHTGASAPASPWDGLTSLTAPKAEEQSKKPIAASGALPAPPAPAPEKNAKSSPTKEPSPAVAAPSEKKSAEQQPISLASKDDQSVNSEGKGHAAQPLLAKTLHEAEGSARAPELTPTTHPAPNHTSANADSTQTIMAPAGVAALSAGAASAPAQAREQSAGAGPPVPISGLAVEIAARARDGKSRFEIRLDPPELGRIDVRLDIDRDGGVSSRLVVDRSETLDLLRRHAPSLERALADAGLTTNQDGLEFSLRNGAFAGREQAEPKAAGVLEEQSVRPVEIPAASVQSRYQNRLGLGAGIDIRV